MTSVENLTFINNEVVIEGGYRDVSPLHKTINDSLLKTINGLKQLRLKLTMNELALISGCSRRSLYNHRSEIDDFWSDSSFEQEDSVDFIIQRSFELYLENSYTIEDLLGLIIGIYLKENTSILDNCTSLKSIYKTGQHIVRVYRLSCSYKNEDGTPVNSNNEFAHYLIDNLKEELTKIFVRSKGYKVGERSKLWKATELLDEYMRMSINKFLMLMSEYHYLFSLSCPCHMLPKKCANNSYIYNNIIIYNEITISISILRGFELRSILNLLSNTIRVTKEDICVAITHDANTDESLGRSYNVFSRIRSKERLQLGYVSYDMNAALQTISLQLINATKDDYPVLWDYTHDNKHKRKIRSEVAQVLKTDIGNVKKKLTAFANGSVSGIGLHDYYKAFQEESDRLRRAVLKHVSLTEPDVLARAKEQSKRKFPKELDWSDAESEETLSDMRDKASVFFFVWTWYERKIRKAMLTILTDGIELHDAVYSKMDIPSNLVENVIRGLTGFDIIIEKEMLECVEQ